jgi:hypothetical protein
MNHEPIAISQKEIDQLAKKIETDLEDRGMGSLSSLGEQFHNMDSQERIAIANQIRDNQRNPFNLFMPHIEFTASGDVKSARVTEMTYSGPETENCTYDIATGKMKTYDLKTIESVEHNSYNYDAKTGKLKTDDTEYLNYSVGKTERSQIKYGPNTIFGAPEFDISH